MILFVAITGPLLSMFMFGTRVVELPMEESEVVDEEVKAVEPESCDDREAWLIVWPRPGSLPLLVGCGP